MNLLASPMSPLPPDEPPPLISLLRYIFNAASPACWTALSLESLDETLPAEDCWSVDARALATSSHSRRQHEAEG